MTTTSGGRGWRRILDLGTGIVVASALALLIHDRVLPEIHRRSEVEVGEGIPGDLRYRLLAGGGTVSAAVPGPALHLVFQSTCPACARTLPRWRELLSARPGIRAYGVGIEDDGAALAYVQEHLPTAVSVRPVSEEDYLRLLRIRVVPTTLVTDRDGRLILRRSGILAPADVEAVLAELDPNAAELDSRGTQ